MSDLGELNRLVLDAIGYRETSVVWQAESPVCNQLLKTVPINQAISSRSIKAMFTGIRWDEHVSRAGETYFSPRDTPAHMRIHPLLHFSERDVWDATFALGIPFCELYAQGYRSLDTKSGTHKTAEIPAWEQDLESSSERDGRSPQKEAMMAQLRAWGYI
jgi:phosphoadenosine phosphosulfate reductase